jgi:DNA-binding XRE family transcriptional regulator
MRRAAEEAQLAKMRTTIEPARASESALFGRRIVQRADSQVPWRELAFLRIELATHAVDKRSPTLAKNLAFLTKVERPRRRSRALAADRTLQALVGDLVSARTAVGMTQEDVAARMWTTKSAISRLESGSHTRPTLSTIEKYVLAVGAMVEIRVRIKR